VEGTFCELRLSPLSEAVKILIPFTSNSQLRPLHCANWPTKQKEVN
jgi:hypothetical protein